MSQLVLQAAGAVAGFFLTGGSPAGAMWGWGLTGAAASLTGIGVPSSHTDVQGPRLGDLSVQSSAYGQPIPIFYGTDRGAGNIIWSTDLVETATSSTQSTGGGGKGGGGGGSSVTTTSYSYSASFAVLLGEGPIGGVLRIWARGKLIYDVTTGASTASVIASTAKVGAIRVYTGSETQTPDALIEAVKGAGNASAYRGFAYVVFENLQLADFGNSLANMNLTFEVCAANTTDLVIQAQGPAYNGSATAAGGYFQASVYGQGGSYMAYQWGVGTGQIANKAESNLIRATLYDPAFPANATNWVFTQDRLFIDGSNAVIGESLWTPDLSQLQSGAMQYFGFLGTANTDELAAIVMANGPSGDSTTYARIYVNFKRQIQIRLPNGNAMVCWAQNGNDIYWVLNNNATGLYEVWYMNIAAPEAVFPAALVTGIAGGAGNRRLCLAASTNYWWLYNGSDGGALSDLTKYARASASVSAAWNTVNVGYKFGFNLIHVIDEQINRLWIFNVVNAHQNIVQIDNGVGSYLNLSTNAPTPNDFMNTCDFYGSGVFAWVVDASPGASWFTSTNTVMYPYWMTVGAAGAGQALSAIVSDLCDRAGLAAAEYDVSELADTAHGYVVARQMSARSAIDPLRACFYFDVVESDAKLKFRKRGGASVATITDDDLAALDVTNSGTWDLPDLITPVRKQELEMPRQLNVNYYNLDADYQQGSQPARRQITDSVIAETVDLPVVLHDAEAAKVAEVLLFDRWMGRESAEIRLSSKYAHLDPADLITVVSATLGATFNLRITEDQYQPHGVKVLQVVPESAAVYSPVAVGAAANSTSQSIALPGPTLAQFMDLPCLRDADSDAGFYIAATGYLPAWANASLFKSLDAGATWSLGAFMSGGVIGVATNALGAWYGGNVWDTVNAFNVKLITPGAALSSVTESQVYNGSNTFCVGNEIVQAMNCVLQGDGTYTCSMLLRNRKGSESTQAGAAHAAGDRVVLLASSAVQRSVAPTTDIGVARSYKAVTTGDTLGATPAQTFTGAGNALKPLAPCNVGGVRNAGNDWIFQWQRRGRLDAEWRDYIDVPLGETSESYSIDILDAVGGTVKRTLTAGAPSGPTVLPSVTYTAAQQTTDFGGTQSIVVANLYQVSAAVGRGFPALAIVGVSPAPGLATWDPAAKSAHLTLSGGNLIATTDATAVYQNIAGNVYAFTGVRFCEITFANYDNSDRRIGLASSTTPMTDGVNFGQDLASYCYSLAMGVKIHGTAPGSGAAYGSASLYPHVIGMRWDAINGTLQFFQDGTDLGIAFTGVFGVFRPAVMGYSYGASATINQGASAWTHPAHAAGAMGW